MSRRTVGLTLIGVGVLVLIFAGMAKIGQDSQPDYISSAEAARILMGGEPEPDPPLPLVSAIIGGVLVLAGGVVAVSSLPAVSPPPGSAPEG